MVKVIVNNDEIFFCFVQEAAFEALRNLCKKNYIFYDDSIHGYSIPANKKSTELIDEMATIAPVYLQNPEAFNAIKNGSMYPPSKELKKVRVPVSQEFLKLNPPLVGKPGFENFQLDAIRRGLAQNRILYSISCRHGKTYISCGDMYTWFERGDIEKVLIIARPEGVDNYKNEILRFIPFLKEDEIEVLRSEDEDSQLRNLEKHFEKKILIMSYTTFRLYCSSAQKRSGSKAKKPRKPSIDFSKFGSCNEKRLIILDECQSINDTQTLQGNWVHLHKNFFDRRIEMSGSLGYSIEKMYSHAKFLLPDTMNMSQYDWETYMMTGMFRDKVIPERAEEFKREVLDKISVHFTDCIKQPDNYQKLLYVEMSPKMRGFYQQVCNQVLTDLQREKGTKGLTMRFLNTKFPYLSQVTDDPELIHDKYPDIKVPVKFDDNPKFEILDSMIEEWVKEGRRIIIWGNHPKSMRRLAEHYKKYNPAVFSGEDNNDENRNELVLKVRNDPSVKILIANKVLSTSITLTEFSRVVWWSLTMDCDYWKQAIARPLGPTQKEKTIETYYLLFKDSCDNYIWYDILQKRSKSKDFMDLNPDEEIPMERLKEIFNSHKVYTIEGQFK